MIQLPPITDRDILRRLGDRFALLASSEEMGKKRELWKQLNRLEASRPMVMVESSEVADEIIPLSTLECIDPWARSVERMLRMKLYHLEVIKDDTVYEPWITYKAEVVTGDYGFEIHKYHPQGEDTLTTYAWKPPVTDIFEALPLLHYRSHTLDISKTEERRYKLEQIFEGILPVVRRGMYWWTTGLTIQAIDLLGLEGLMFAMYDQSEALHALMAFLRDDQLHEFSWYEQQGLLYPNNRDDYIGSGGGGYTDELPLSYTEEGKNWTVGNMWGLSESQETVGVSPEMFAEFVFPYQKPVISQFGLACYGCCEPVDNRWHIIATLPNLRRVSVSPWADVEKMAENIDRSYVFSRKPNPSLVSNHVWEEATIISDLRSTIEIAGKLNLELVLKDVHTLSNRPERLSQWVSLARKEIEQICV